MTAFLSCQPPPRRSLRDPHAYWLTLLVTLALAWLTAFVTLIPTPPGARPQFTSAALWILSASAALIGAIATEAQARGAESDRQLQLVTLWRLGVLGFIPAWVLAMSGHVLWITHRTTNRARRPSTVIGLLIDAGSPPSLSPTAASAGP